MRKWTQEQIDAMVGKRFSRLVVENQGESVITSSGSKMRTWNCVCDCGNRVNVRERNLISGNTTSCGCLKQEQMKKRWDRWTKDITGQVFGKLTVLERVENKVYKSGRSEIQYKCVCECGNETIVRRGALTSGNTQSCGCLHNDGVIKAANKNRKDLTGKQFNELTVIRYVGNVISESGRSTCTWECRCSCGNTVTVRAGDLRSGRVKSCGCLLSGGEAKIKKILREFNINANSQYSFDDLIGENGYKLRYDFGVLDCDSNLKYLIEYDGVQHYKDIHFFDSLEDIQTRDRIKNAYCLDHNITLIRLPVLKPDEITIEDLVPETSQYVVKSVDQYQDLVF